MRLLFVCSGGRILTSDLRVMSPTIYQLLYPAVFETAKVERKTELPKNLFYLLFCRSVIVLSCNLDAHQREVVVGLCTCAVLLYGRL